MRTRTRIPFSCYPFYSRSSSSPFRPMAPAEETTSGGGHRADADLQSRQAATPPQSGKSALLRCRLFRLRPCSVEISAIPSPFHKAQPGLISNYPSTRPAMWTYAEDNGY